VSINDETLRLARQLRIRVDREVDATVRDLVRSWARAWDEIHDAWAQAADALIAASRDGAWPDQWTIARHDRAVAALLAANDKTAELAEHTGITVTDAAGRAVEFTPEFEARLIASQMPRAAGARADLVTRFNRVDATSLQWIVQRTTEQILGDASSLGVYAQEQMRRTLIRGVALGDNPRQAARRMVRQAEGAFNGGLTRALTIARTEILDAHRASASASQMANRDVLSGWVWLAQLDTRTCPSCLAKHGTVHDLDETGPNDHPQGRCARMPKARSWRDLGIDLDEPADITPDAQAWFADLERQQQLQVMGPARLQALDGGVPWSDLTQQRTNPGWRDSWVPTPARDLLARVA
jgi:SPP1 gp7 family putative phage head morphogenesis protein